MTAHAATTTGTPTSTPSWQHALDLVRHIVDAGHPEAIVEVPGLRLVVSTVDVPMEDDVLAAAPAASIVAVPSPVVGTFYRRPAPTQPPFVEVGSEVASDTVVAIVEVMKLMVAVEAGVAGRIARVCAQDASQVEEGQALFEVVRSEDGDG